MDSPADIQKKFPLKRAKTGIAVTVAHGNIHRKVLKSNIRIEGVKKTMRL
jgi:hypothetical protein